MTNEEWQKVKEKLVPPFGHVKLTVDGYRVSVGYVRTGETKYSLAVYIDGIFKGEWLSEDCEIRRRFCHCSQKQLFTGNEKKKLIGKIGKREYEKLMKRDPRMYYTVYEPYFGSFRTLKAHLIKNNKSIELDKPID